MRLLLLLLSSWAVTVSAQGLNARLEKIVKNGSIARENLGLSVIELDAGASPSLFAVNEGKAFIPASVTKLATASAVLQRLGPSFKFQTTLWSAGQIKDGVLSGDLILKGGGDPGFVSETMWFLVNEFVRNGVKRVEGNIVVDDTDFDAIRADPSRDPERVDRAYDAPVGAMSFNWNSINIFVRPLKVGESPQVYLDPLPDYFRIDNKAKVNGKAGVDLQIERAGEQIRVRGTLGIGHDEVVAYKNVDDPVDWTGKNLVYFLRQRGITVSGKVKAGKKPSGARLVAKADSKPVSQAVADMLKFSNNYVAEMLTKDLALHGGVIPANLESGMQLVRSHLTTTVGLDAKRFILLNPSGLSRRNRITPRDLVEILAQAERHFPTFAEMLSGLPLAGMDGTLKRRLANSPVTGWVRAKTGNLSGVVALAGYAGRKDGGIRAFAFIFNGKANQGESARHLFDALAAELVQ
jgi:D-alanyl-D-alanine carboxypeptidase/D-alanyl-D-alanine-endopeptidase (penicillin-binding protein 4)